jgi:pyrimidine-nucleoside phosphorylase
MLPVAPIREPVLAPASGHVSALDALEIALAAKALGAGRDRKEAAIDLSVGIVLEKKVGDPVQVGEILAVVHAGSPLAAQNVTGRVAAAFTIGPQAAARSLLLRRVTASGIERLDT